MDTSDSEDDLVYFAFQENGENVRKLSVKSASYLRRSFNVTPLHIWTWFSISFAHMFFICFMK